MAKTNSSHRPCRSGKGHQRTSKYSDMATELVRKYPTIFTILNDTSSIYHASLWTVYKDVLVMIVGFNEKCRECKYQEDNPSNQMNCKESTQ